MASRKAIAAAIKSIPGGSRAGSLAPVATQMLQQNTSNSYANSYGPFLPRPSRVFTDGAFGPMSPINPIPVDENPPGAAFPDPRLFEYRVGWNLPTPPGTEGLKLASFDQLNTLSKKYSVARQCIELRKDEILGLEWSIELTTDAAKAYQGDRKAMRDFGERKMLAMKFFKRPDPDYWSFHSWMEAFLEEIFVYDALSLVFRPKYGSGLGRGLLGSDLDHIKLVSGPTIRPLLNMHGGTPHPPSPAYQQFLYGVPRSDYVSMMRGTDIVDYGLGGSEINTFRSDVMLYAPMKPTRESPYGFPPVERALLPIISGLQKQEFQLDYFTEGTVPAVYISPGDPNITPTQIKELQDALNAIAGDPAYHMKVLVLPPGSKVEPQRPVDLSDSFDNLVQTQVCMAFDVQPTELGILPNIGSASSGGGQSASAVRFGSQEARDLKSRKSTKPMLKFLCDIFNYVLQDMCNQPDMQFQFEGLVDDEDKQQITELGVEQVQNGIASIDEVRERLDLAPWGLTETSEPVVFTAQGPIPFSMAPDLILAAQQGANGGSSTSNGSGNRSQGTNGGQKTTNTRSRTSQPSVRRGGQTKPNGSHPSPVSPHREAATPGHAAAAGAVQGPTPRTGGTPNRSSVAGSRKKAASAEFDALKRHLRKGRLISTWDPRHISDRALGSVAEDIAKGVLIDTAIERAEDLLAGEDFSTWEIVDETGTVKNDTNWAGWDSDQGLVSQHKDHVGDAFHRAEVGADQIRKDAINRYSVSGPVLRGLINDQVKEVFTETLTPLWTQAWNLGYASAKSLTPGSDDADPQALEAFIATEGEHWLQQVSKTGLGNNSARTEVIARTEVARAMNAGAMQCYADNGVAYKHLLVAPDDTCDTCLDAADDGVIPLSASYSVKGQEPPFHPQCRCVSVPAFGQVGKSSVLEDNNRVGFLLIRAKGDDGKQRYLLQQRNDGTWGMPGGTCHIGEGGWDCAYRETIEEIGDLPPLTVVTDLHHFDSDGVEAFLYLVDADQVFAPKLNGSTPEETAGTGWFKRKEVGDLDLVPKFRDDWEHIIPGAIATKALAVNENGEVGSRQDGPGKPFASGGVMPTPHRGDGTQVGDSGGSDFSPGGGLTEDDWMSSTNTLLMPWGDDGLMPPKRDVGGQGPQKPTPSGGAPDKPSNPGEQPPVASIGAGASPGEKGQGKPVVGSVPAKTPQPMKPGSVPPQLYDPSDAVEHWDPEAGSDVVVPVPPKKKKTATAPKTDPRMPGPGKVPTYAATSQNPANPKDPGGPSDYSDPNETDTEHILSLLRPNFPEKALAWVKRSRWIGPVNIPWDRIDTSDIDEWDATHQLDAVNRFAREIKAGIGHLSPSTGVQRAGDDTIELVDGHHRALARRKLGMPILCYVAFVPYGQDTQDALAMHKLQIHSGEDPKNV
jgi:8-oxo-dGTP pyrophosphatase MutT (NUDIX family)